MKVRVIETYIYDIEVEAENNKKAIKKAKEMYKDEEIEWSADACSFEKVSYKVIK